MTNDNLNKFFDNLSRTLRGQKVVYETNGVRSGESNLADIGIASYALAAHLAAHTDDPQACIDELIRHKNYDHDFELVLYGAIINLATHYLEPAYKALDGSELDARADAVSVWDAIREAPNDHD
jgi:hypothetical protein